ncbi:MAG: extracellular solute-binding protein [Firmicutes bacterium]|nr:extracellular solute-binding protein [Bacillota bacterium]
MKKKLIRLTSMGLAAVMAFGLAACTNGGGSTGGGGGTASNEYTKPESIKMTFDTCMTPENGVNDVCKKYEELTGIKLELEKPDHNKYYEKITLAFASDNPADVIEMGSTYYPENANNGALWDMTDAWENTTAHCKEIIDESYVEALKMDVRDGSGMRLYGFPTVAGNGTITYVREDWMKDAGYNEPPTDYAGFIDMLRKFKARGNGAIPLTAAGLLNNGETPYDIYLREFYQDAKPDFYQKEDGTWADGFSEPEMAAALTRLREAFAEGLIDGEIVTNKTSTCRDKFNSGLVGAFNYWAGMWDAKLEDNTPGATLIPMPAIAETGGYTERVPTAMVITNKCTNPVGVFEDLIMYSHDGGEGQMLFTRGVEGEHYEKKEDGTTVALPYIEDPTKPVEKAFYAPELSITTWDDPIALDPRVENSLEVFRSNRKFATVPVVSDVISDSLANLNVIKGEVVANVLHGNLSVDEGMEKYNKEAAPYVEAILADLNG